MKTLRFLLIAGLSLVSFGGSLLTPQRAEAITYVRLLDVDMDGQDYYLYEVYVLYALGDGSQQWYMLRRYKDMPTDAQQDVIYLRSQGYTATVYTRIMR